MTAQAVPAPRCYAPQRPAFGAHGTPSPRLARFTARLAFVDVKREFLAATASLEGTDWLHRQVRAAEQPADLWLLRGAVGEALAAHGREADERRLRASLATLFPQGATPSRC